jgi:F0F1-type ATP synthase delta subunit
MQETLTVMIPVIAAHILILVAVVFVIKRLLLGDTMRAVGTIREVEEEVRKREEAVRREIAEHEKELAARKAEAEEELQRRREEAEREAGRLRDQVVEEARGEAEQVMAQARRNEEKLRRQIEQSVNEKAVDYAGEIFRLVLSDKMSEELDRRFIDELLEALREMDAANITLDTEQAEFRASRPIDPEQKARLGAVLSAKFGVDVDVSETIDESLLGGLVFKMGSLEIDGSLRNRLAEAVAELKKAGRE